MTNREKEWVEKLAKDMGTYIPGGMSVDAWPLPIIEALVERVQVLGLEIDHLKKR